MKQILSLLVLCVVSAGCQQPIETSPDLPSTPPVRNPDFIAGSVWVNENTTSPFREFRIQPGRKVVAVINGNKTSGSKQIPGVIDGTHTLRLTTPKETQKLMSGYPTNINYPSAVLFTDNPTSPSVAQITLLIPGAGNYFVLLGSYIKGLDTMEWNMFLPVSMNGVTTLSPAPTSLFKGELVFRRK